MGLKAKDSRCFKCPPAVRYKGGAGTSNPYIEIGLEIVETLKLKDEPLSEDVINRYTNNGRDTDLVEHLMEVVFDLETCADTVPAELIAKVCRCHKNSINALTRNIMSKVGKNTYEAAKKAEGYDLPRPIV